MKFEKALKKMRKGHKVGNYDWNSGVHMYMKSNAIFVEDYGKGRYGFQIRDMSIKDIISDRYYVVEEVI